MQPLLLAVAATAGILASVAVRGRPEAIDRVQAAVPAAQLAVELRLGSVDWSEIEVIATTSAETAGSSAPAWAAAFAVPAKGRIVLRLDRVGPYPHSTLGQVLAHELGHIALGRRLPGGGLPRWFEEGLCMSIARERGAADAWRLSRALLFGGSADLATLEGWFHGGETDAQAGYALALDLVRHLEEKAGVEAPRHIVAAVAAGQSFEDAVAATAGTSLADLADAWHRQALFTYRWVPLLTSTVTLWLGISLLVLVAWARKRRRGRELRASWALEEGELSEEDTTGPYGPH